MSSKLEKLPKKILQKIIQLVDEDRDYEGPENLINLVKCSRKLRESASHLVYDKENDLNSAIWHGCITDNIDCINRASEYGASISSVTNGSDGQTKHIPLTIAAMHGSANVFEWLLHNYVDIRGGMDAMNVDMEDAWFQAEMKLLVSSVCRAAVSANGDEVEIARSFFLWGLHHEIRMFGGGPELYDFLVKLIVSKAPIDIVRLALDHGADLDRPQQHASMGLLTPLSAAVVANAPGIFGFLISRGADIHGQAQAPQQSGNRLHIPIVAADHMIARSGGKWKEMKDLCLAFGADLADLH